MRTTVGPLPSAVYWRRRAAVLGALLLGVLILFVACTSGDDSANRPGAGPGTTGRDPGATPPSGSVPSTEPSFEDAGPGGGPDLPTPDEVTGSGGPGAGGPTPGAATPGGAAPGAPGGPADAGVNVAAAGGQCADTEMSVTPVPALTAAQRGSPIDIRLKIKNVSTRTCERDVGADLQEIYIKQGARKVWSSDTCSTAKGSEMRPFTTNLERDYGVTWNGRESTRCSNGLAVGPTPPPGEYEVFGRLGGKISAPIRLTLS